eukprot:970566_1
MEIATSDVRASRFRDLDIASYSPQNLDTEQNTPAIDDTFAALPQLNDICHISRQTTDVAHDATPSSFDVLCLPSRIAPNEVQNDTQEAAFATLPQLNDISR